MLGSSSLFHAGFEFEREGILDVGYQLYGSFSLLRRIALWFLRKVKVPLLLFFTLSCHHSLLAEGPVAQTQLVVQTAQQFLGLLNEEQKAQALFTLENPERENWHYVPMEREGLRIDAMDKKQQGAAHELLAQSLSAQGHLIANDSIRLEELLYKRSNQSDLRDPGKYTVALFGMPSLKKPWGWRFEGHHLSFNFTIVSDKVALATPFFVGTNPAEVRAGELKGLRPLGAIEDAARTLARSIHGDGLHVRYTNDPPREILTRQDRVAQKQATEGVAYSSLDGAYQKQLLKLVQLITANQRPDFLAISAKELSESYFAWAGEFEQGEPHYFRIQTPVFLVEYVNLQNDANHAHLVWRDFKGDFGRDILREHLEKKH